MDEIDHGKVILSAILHGRADLLAETRVKVPAEYFVDPQQTMMLGLIEQYHGQYGEVLTRDAIADLLRSELPGVAMQCQTYYDALMATEATEGKFRASLDQLCTLGEDRLVGEALSQGMEILRHGADKNGRRLRGASDARAHVLSVLAEKEDPAGAGQIVLPAIPEYPTQKIIGPLGDLVRSTKLPSALVGGAGLAVIAALAADADLILPDGSREWPALWIPLMAPRSGAKSPSMQRRALPPFYALERQARETYISEFAQWKSLPDEDRVLTPRPLDRTLLISDVTMEAVARKLNRGSGAALMAYDELSGFLEGIGQYKRASSDKGRLLALWTCEPWSYQRVGADKDGGIGIDILVMRPAVTIVGGIQPHLHPLLGDDDSGLRARWLPHLSVARTVPFDRWSEPGRDRWNHVIQCLGQFRGKRRDWGLGQESTKLWLAAGEEWKRQAETEPNASAAAALAKADLQAARVAVVLVESLAACQAVRVCQERTGSLDALQEYHPALRTGNDPLSFPGEDPDPENPLPRAGIPAQVMQSAIAIVDYCMQVWRALPSQERLALSLRDERLGTAVEKVRDYAETRPERKASKGELLRNHVAGIRTAKDLGEVLTEYERTYPGSVRSERSGQRGPAGVYVYSPARADSASPGISPLLSAETVAVNS